MAESVADLQRQFWRAQKGGIGVHKARAKLRRAMVGHRQSVAEETINNLSLNAVGHSPSSSRSNSPALSRSSTPSKSRPGSTARERPAQQLNTRVLLRVCEAKSSEYVTVVDVSGKRLKGAAKSELAKFKGLTYLDAGDNSIPLEDLTELTGLEELHLHCNGITSLSVEQGSFPSLRILDLSFNKIPSRQLNNLLAIEKLQELDLTKNGLKTLPNSFAQMRSLESVVLEDNLLGDSPTASVQLWTQLCSLPSLRAVVLDGNKLNTVLSPGDMRDNNGYFTSLEFISLARNDIDREDGVRGLLSMPELREAVLVDNPFIRLMRKGAEAPLLDTLVTRSVAVVLHPGVLHECTIWQEGSEQTQTPKHVEDKTCLFDEMMREMVEGKDEEGDEMTQLRADRAVKLVKKKRERREEKRKEREGRRGDDMQFFLTAVPGQEAESDDDDILSDYDQDYLNDERVMRHRSRGLHLSDIAAETLLGVNDDPVVDSILSLPSQTGAAINPDESNIRALYAALRFAMEHPVQVSLLPGDLGPADMDDGVVTRDERMLEMEAAQGLVHTIKAHTTPVIQHTTKVTEPSVDDLIFDIRRRLASVEDNLATVVASHGKM